MANDLLAREPIADFGEFRAYLRAERQEMVFEAFREADGRAWLLRVPLAARAAMAGLLREVDADAGRRARRRRPIPASCARWRSGPKDAARRRAARGRPGARLRPVAAGAAAHRLELDHRRAWWCRSSWRASVCALMRQVIERAETPAAADGLVDHPQLELGLLGHHRRVPGRVPDDLDLAAGDALDRGHLLLDLAGQGLGDRAVRARSGSSRPAPGRRPRCRSCRSGRARRCSPGSRGRRRSAAPR